MNALFNDTTAKTYATRENAVKAITKFIAKCEENRGEMIPGHYVIAVNETGRFFVIVRSPDMDLAIALVHNGFCAIN